ncbi:MBL fold metallo-hydrolase [Pararhodobacter marinus]|uniref:MBL fold metallo-hydrolase n=1 Tax=Pararhodobacter marinus TaxID=2184063 RepID=A0A2U2CBE4_9RHOB|nr:MBL fold metallo-hydrolase [Pararhodobacter marinus]PWE29215.1 MBL fold metallo-hydrolase [Pararhodobacter marinus]
MPDAPFDPLPGRSFPLAPGLRLVLAPNPSPMTERGTNTYLLGEGAVTVVDPGPADPDHLRAILDALAPGERIERIVVTHAHKDHSPLARPLAEATGAPVAAFGNAQAGQSPRMAALIASGAEMGGGEGVDADFAPDEILANGDATEAGGLPLRAVHTPGHLGNHLCFLWGDALFSGDHVMGWAPSLVSPPEGDLTDFMASLDRLEALGQRRYYPGHGAPVEDGLGRTRALRDHRQGREAAIRAAVGAGAVDLRAITAAVYTDVPEALLPAAARNVLAHLIDLDARGLLRFDGPPGPQTPVIAP